MGYNKTIELLKNNNLFMDIIYDDNYNNFYDLFINFYELYNNGYSRNNLVIYTGIENYKSCYSGDTFLCKTKRNFMIKNIHVLRHMEHLIKFFERFIYTIKFENSNHILLECYKKEYYEELNKIPLKIKNKRIFKEFIQTLEEIQKYIRG